MIVLSQIPREPHNALWNMFSSAERLQDLSPAEIEAYLQQRKMVESSEQPNDESENKGGPEVASAD